MTVPRERITRSILLSCGQKVLLDADLAPFYGVDTGALPAPPSATERFPYDFMFQLTKAEVADLKLHLGI